MFWFNDEDEPKIIEPKMVTKTKKCSKCGKEKLVSLFNKDKNKPDGLNSYCKACTREYLRDWKKQKMNENQESDGD